MDSQFCCEEVFVPAKNPQHHCHLSGRDAFKEMYNRSIGPQSVLFWGEIAKSMLTWQHPFTKVKSSNFASGDVSWFLNGKLNVTENCVDRWAAVHPDKTALIWETDDPADSVKISYIELQAQVCKLANGLVKLGVRRYDTVAVYLSTCHQLVYSLLACARIGAVHCVIFIGFSAHNLGERIRDLNCKVVITSNFGMRGGKLICLKDIVDEALESCPSVQHCIVFERLKRTVDWVDGRDHCGEELMKSMRSYCPCSVMDSEDLLFILHTSGSTGSPKGVAHSSAGYLLYTALTFKYVFDHHPGDVYGCMADAGWITGHSYVIYGPLCNGATTVLFESTPVYPDPGRYWCLVERHSINAFYTSPTAIRMLMRYGDEIPGKYNLDSLRVLGCVGERINPDAWKWYFNVIGRKKCHIVDTYWQTETGGHVITPIPGCVQTKPGCASLPFFGIEACILDTETGEELKENGVCGALVVKNDWPGIMRTIYGHHERFVDVYFTTYPGYYFTGDGAVRDADGLFWITGRIDDTVNVSGHLLGTSEIEGALCTVPEVMEGAAVTCPHSIKGNGLFCFIIVKQNENAAEDTSAACKAAIRRQIGPIATPDHILAVDELPKTRSGKICRRLLRQVLFKDTMGVTETLANPECIQTIVRRVEEVTFG
eukprot:Lankesteria_metandrocarpae@DN3931_c0_g1_i2.p1